ncbi:hypothetical protein KC946_00035 [Candidatus Saccharibacteria bacterium]|nr:hypothetical protein [Candidatus Saccharibacteria bacterium]
MKNKTKKIKLNKITTIILVMAFAVVGTYLLTASEAATANASLSITPSSGNYSINSNVALAIYENSGSQEVSTVDVTLTYDANKLEFVSVDNNGGPFDRVFENSGGNGTVKLVVSKFGGSVINNQKVGNLVFKAKAGSGSTAVQFGSESKIVTFAATPENVWNGNTTGASFNFTTPDTTNPSVTFVSPTNGYVAVGIVPIQVSVQDDGQISKVEFWVNGSKVHTSTQSPYSYNWDSTQLSDRSNVPILVKAFDSASPTPNEGSKSITISIKNSKPNLVISSLVVSPENPKAGDQVTITAKVRNSGSDNIASGVSISNLFKLDSSNLNNPLTISGLNLNTEKTITTNWTATRGSHTITAVADQNNTIVEANESDNQSSKTIKVYKQADANDDNKVDAEDLAIFAFNYGKPGVKTFADGDYNGDGTVDTYDVAILSFNWGK